MINIEFNIDKYDWKVYLYVNVDNNDIEYILHKLSELHCEYSKAVDIYNTLSKDYLNKGFTYTNYHLHTSVVIICQATNKGQYVNTIVHELNHLKSHIANAFKLNEKGEEVSYLIGNIAEIIYDKIEE